MTRAFLLSDILPAFESLASCAHRHAPNKDWSYPPTDLVVTGEDSFELRFALAGTKLEQIDISSELQHLTVSVTAPEAPEEEKYIVKSIAKRSFSRKFALDKYIEVGEASFVDGLLTIKLARVIPDAQKKRSIAIS
jgi:molecular chaperone IbpA